MQMMTPKISIGIPFKNPGDYFKLAIQSVFAQTFTDWELILVDDGSTDDSLTFAQGLQDERIRVYSDGATRGLNVRLNQMVQLAKADYFARMDADDMMHPQRLAKQYAQLIQSDQNTVVGSAAYSINANSQVVGVRPIVQPQSGFAARHSFIHPTVMAATAWFRRHPYSENFVFQRSQDAELWCRTAAHTRFINLPEPLLYYRESGVFSFANYLGTSLGLLQLIAIHYQRPRYRFLYLFSLEIIKLLIAAIVDCFNISDLLVAKRYQSISLDADQNAIAGMAIVKQQSLPLGVSCNG
jgi:glycosyltransferase involved in cell wall biosynthesis